MKKQASQDMIVLGRESRGFTQKDLSKKLGISQGKLSKLENGFLKASSEIIGKLSRILNYPTQFFFRSHKTYSPSITFYRKYKSLTKKEQNRISALIDLQRIHVQELLQSTEIIDELVMHLDTDEYGTPQDIAQIVRAHLGIPRGPIDNLIELVENAGIMVIERDFGSSKFFGTSTTTEKQEYIIFIDKNMPADRARFTIAHELGHIFMHRLPKLEAEEEANAFAAEFLMPAQEIKSSLQNLNIEILGNLKIFWKVSMAALLFRAFDLTTITERKYRFLWTQMAKLGYKKKEPLELDIPKEDPSLLNDIIKLHLDDLEYSTEELCELIGLYEDEFDELYPISKGSSKPNTNTHLRIVT